MLLSETHRKNTQILQQRFCGCQTEYGPHGQIGKSTRMRYLGEGRYMCPVCGTLEDNHEVTYRLFIKVSKNSKEIVNPIIDSRLNKGKNREIIQTAIYDDVDDEFCNHSHGLFEVELVYNVWGGDCGDGEEYDEEMFIVSERKSKI